MAIFSQEIKAAQAQGDPDRGDTYFSHWCSTLERICVERGLTDWHTYAKQVQLWHQAVINTPHGVPLAIENANLAPQNLAEGQEAHGHDHHGHHHPHGDLDHLPENMFEPVAVISLRGPTTAQSTGDRLGQGTV